MKKIVSLSLILLGVLIIVGALLPARNPGDFDLVGFGRLPVVVNGRVKPLDTVARTTLVVLQSSQTLYVPVKEPPAGLKLTPDEWRARSPKDWRTLPPTEWLLDVFFNGKKSDTYQHFEINHPDVLAIFGLSREEGRDGKRFSFQQLQPKFGELQKQVELVQSTDAKLRTNFQKAVAQLYSNLGLYLRLRGSLVAPDDSDFLGELLDLQKNVVAGVAAVRAKQAGQPHDAALVDKMLQAGERFDRMSELASLYAIPPDTEADTTGWKRVGASLLESFRTGRVNSTALAYAGLARAWRDGKPEQFNNSSSSSATSLDKRFAPQLSEERRRGALQRRAAVLLGMTDLRARLLRRRDLMARMAEGAGQAPPLAARGSSGVAHRHGRHRHPHVARGPPAGDQSLLLRALHRLGRRRRCA
jgi:hypothetical protein